MINLKKTIPEWILSLDEEDLKFIKNFVLSSGSLKEIAANYQVTYPTVRLRLDRLIQKIQMNDQTIEDSFVRLVKNLALDEKMDYDTAKLLIQTYKKEKEEL